MKKLKYVYFPLWPCLCSSVTELKLVKMSFGTQMNQAPDTALCRWSKLYMMRFHCKKKRRPSFGEQSISRWSEIQLFSTGVPTVVSALEKKTKHPVVRLNNPEGLHFSNHNRSVIYVPVTRHDRDPDWAPRRHAIDPHSQESQLPLKLWQWNCTASIGHAGATILFIEERSIHYSLMSDNWWQVGSCFLPWPWQTECQMDYI